MKPLCCKCLRMAKMSTTKRRNSCLGIDLPPRIERFVKKLTSGQFMGFLVILSQINLISLKEKRRILSLVIRELILRFMLGWGNNPISSESMDGLKAVLAKYGISPDGL